LVEISATIGIGGTAKGASHAFGRTVERNVEIAVTGDLTAGRFKRERIPWLVPEEPGVLLSRLGRQIGHLRLRYRRRHLGLLRLGLRLRGLLLGRFGVRLCRVGIRCALGLLRFELLHLLLQGVDLRLERFERCIRNRRRILRACWSV
jgi:hypothetical protein